MTDLTITQNNTAETVTLAVLNKLYETVYALGTGHAHINGTINIQAAHRNKTDYLTNRFNGGNEGTLSINVSLYYIDFGDSTVESLLANRYGDGVGVTLIQATAVTEINNYLFRSQSSIIKADLSSFVNLRKITTHMFENNSNLLEVIFPQSLEIIDGGSTFSNDTKLEKCIIPGTINLGIGAYCFHRCNNLEQLELRLGQNISTMGTHTFKDCYKVTFNTDTFLYITKIEGPCFYDCRAVTELNFPSLTTIANNWAGSGFSGCSSLKKINLGHITSMDNGGYFGGCISLKVIDFGDSITSMSSNVVPSNISAVQACIFRTTTPPSCSSTSFGGNVNVKIFVPDAAISTYLATAPFDSFGSSRVLPLSLYVETDYIPAAS